MADIQRRAEGTWNGDLMKGNGTINSASGVLRDTPYSFRTRFEQEPGTNPEELIAAAHAGCYSMAFAHTLSSKGHQPERIHTRAVCSLSPKQGGGFEITRMRLETTGRVPGWTRPPSSRSPTKPKKPAPSATYFATAFRSNCTPHWNSPTSSQQNRPRAQRQR
jgi:osmotically inducible protein OsmC